MNEVAIARDDRFVEISDSELDHVNGGVASAALMVFFAAAAVGYMMGADWAKQDK